MLVVVLAIAHGGAVAVVVALDIPVWAALAGAAMIVANLYREVRSSALLLAANSVVAIEVASDNVLSVQTRRGDWVECEALGSTYVLSFLTILNLKSTARGARMRAVILPDSIAAEEFRKLRVWLRWR